LKTPLHHHPKHHPRSPGFALFIFQINDFHGDLAFEPDVVQSDILNETLFELILPEENL